MRITRSHGAAQLSRILTDKRLLAALQLALLVVLSFWSVPAKAATQTVTFTFTRVVELNCDEGVGEACPNDYYPKVDIDAQGLDDGKGRFCCAHGTDFQPNWVFSRTVDTSHNPVGIHIELWDQDDLSGDDQIDIANGPNSLDVFLNTNSCTWSGGGLSGAVNTQSSSQGSGSDSAKIYFMINSTSANCTDSDGDGLLDGWETSGYDADGNGTVDVNLPLMGAKLLRKDLYLELDFLAAAGHTHAPLQAAIQQVVKAFANAPIANPDGTTGIQLHIDVGTLYGAGVVTNVVGAGGVTGTFGDYGGGGNQFAEAGNTIIDYDGPAGNPGTNFFTLKNMNTNRDNIFRYAMFVHQTNTRAAVNDCTSGLAKGIPGVNFFVSLGGTRGGSGNPACWGTDGTGQSVGTQAQQAGTLMHEFGHTLGLQHGGGDGLNNKPNYPSVMNYLTQNCAVAVIPAAGLPGGCDYSRINLPPLNESSLDECQGTDGGLLGLGPVDFNINSRTDGVTNCQPPNNSNVGAEINADTSTSTLNGFQDWNAIVYNFRTVFDFTTAGTPSPQEPDSQTIEKSRAYVQQRVQPILKVAVTGPADARPGDSVSYSVTVTNKASDGARGPAVNVAATATKPDASTQAFDLGTVILGSTRSNAVAYAIPCSVTDGTVLNTAFQVHGSDLLSNVVSDASTLQTRIHAPVLALSKTATATVNAGEAITYDIHYENTGSADAGNVVVTDILPAGVYYSQALDKGTGPKPATVTLNGDGTRTLMWMLGTLAVGSGGKTIDFTARPTLLALGGTVFTNNASLSFQAAPSCAARKLDASANTSISVVPLTHENERHRKLYWMEHGKEESAEILARIQATDQRYDGRDGTVPDGALSSAEVKKAFAISLWTILFHHDSPPRPGQELLALYFNLATRRLNADTPVRPEDTRGLGFTNVRDAGIYGNATMLMPFNSSAKKRYEDSRGVIDEIND